MALLPVGGGAFLFLCCADEADYTAAEQCVVNYSFNGE